MKVLIPADYEIITNQALTDYEGADDMSIPVWDAGSAYNLGDRVRRMCAADNSAINIAEIEYVCEARTNIDAGADPAVNTLLWQRLRASAPYLAFDKHADTSSLFNENAVLEISFSKAEAFYSLMTGEFLIEALRSDGSAAWSENITVEPYAMTETVDWYSYFFTKFVPAETHGVFRETPSDFDMNLRFTSLRDKSRIGRIATGTTYSIGGTRLGASAGIIDYSVKETDESGETYLKQRRFKKTSGFSVSIPTSEFSAIYSILASLRAKPTVWISSDVEALQIYGFYKDFSQVYSLHTVSECSLEIEGLI
ncbi:MAG: hypothetical protein LBT81_02335 [Helicobacteraceae bacterium]|nr:hypothetical protein [Helicobacteraceae bacterium]